MNARRKERQKGGFCPQQEIALCSAKIISWHTQLKARYEICFPTVITSVFQRYTAHSPQLPVCPSSTQTSQADLWTSVTDRKAFPDRRPFLAELSLNSNQPLLLSPQGDKSEMAVCGMGPGRRKCSSYLWAFSSLGQKVHQVQFSPEEKENGYVD